MMNTLYCGDNLGILREHIADEANEDLLNRSEGPRYPDMARGGLNFKKAKKERGKDQPKLFDA